MIVEEGFNGIRYHQSPAASSFAAAKFGCSQQTPLHLGASPGGKLSLVSIQCGILLR